MRFSLVITSSMGMSVRETKRRSRLVRMPTSRAFAGDGDAGDLEAAHEFERVGDGLLGRDGDRIDDHAGFRALDLVDLAGLLRDGQVAMDDADATLLGHGDGQARLGDGVHGGRDQRRGEGDVAGEMGLGADLGGNDFAVGRDEQNIVEGQSFRDRGGDHFLSVCGVRGRLFVREGMGGVLMIVGWCGWEGN